MNFNVSVLCVPSMEAPEVGSVNREKTTAATKYIWQIGGGNREGRWEVRDKRCDTNTDV